MGILKIKSAIKSLVLRACAFLSMLMAAPFAFAIASTNMTTSTTTKKFDDVATNIDTISQQSTTLLIQLFTLGGFVLVAISLYQIYKASKDEREKPTSAIVGLMVGGLLAAVGTVLWAMKNSLI
jgi:cytochrome bd-type quinol oxidase subunit 1